MTRFAAVLVATGGLLALAIAPSFAATPVETGFRPTAQVAAPSALVSQPESGKVSFNLFPSIPAGSPPIGASWYTDIQYPRTNQTVTFYGFASDADNDIATYAWNWGDGTTAAPDAIPQAPHAYSAPGTYTVRLTVTDLTAQSTSYENTIVVRDNWGPAGVGVYPPTNAATYPKAGVSNTYNFYGYDQEQPYVDPLQWHIDWGDGTTSDPAADSPDPQVSHAYANAGTYVIHYSATDQDTATHKTVYGVPMAVTVAVHPGPISVGWYSDTNYDTATTGQTVTFTGYATDPNDTGLTTYEWDWNGDGTYDTTSNDAAGTGSPGSSQATHSYAQPGTYAVGLRVTNVDGGKSTYSYTFSVTNPLNGPIGYLYSDTDYGYYGYAATAGRAITFYGYVYSLPIGVTATQYVFHWGDGTGDTSTASGQTQHTYASPGTYRPSVTITLSNAQTLTVQYASYVFDPNSPYGTYLSGPLQVVDNAPPDYAYAYVTNDTGCLHANTSLGFTLVGNDPDGGHIATFDVDWNGDGTFDSSGIAASSDTATINHTFTTDGHYTVIVRAHDSDSPAKAYTDLFDANGVDITADNCAPFGYVTHSPDLPQTNKSIAFDASYSYDLDGTVQSYQWDWNQDGTYDSTGVSAAHTYSTDGLHYYTLKITDNQGLSSYSTQSVETHTGNHLPQFLGLYISDTTPNTAQTVYFDAAGYDDDGTITQYKWDWDCNGVVDQTTSSPSTSHLYASPGTYHPCVKLVDDDGGTVSSSLSQTFTVTVSAAVPGGSLAWAPIEPHPGTTINFTAFASSPNGAINQYTWHWGDGTADTVTTVPNANHAFATASTFPVSVTVRDTTNATGTISQGVTVMSNWPPHAFFTASPQCTTTSTSITFDATGTYDSDNAVVSYHWDFNDGATADTNTVTTTHSFSTPGTYLVKLVAKDAGNASSAAYERDITVQSGNCPPQDVYFTYSPQSLPSGSPISFTGHAVDPDGSITSYTWSWGDGTSDTISPTSGGSTTMHTFANPGLYTVQVIARDNQGLAGEPYALQIVVGVDTTPPTVTLTTPANASFTNDTTPTYSGTAGNDVNDSASVTVKIYSGPTVSGSPVQTRVATRSGTSWTIDGSPALADGTYTAQAQQADAANNIGFSAPHTFTVDTAAPIVTVTTPASSSSTNDTTPTYSGTASAGTGDSTTVVVKIYAGSSASGSPVQTLSPTRSGTSWTIDGTPALAEGTYTVQASQSDAAGNTGTSTARTFVIDTTAPVVTLVTPAASAQTNDTTPTYSGAAGNITGDSTTVVVKIYSGSSVSGSPVQTLSPTRSGTSWTIDGTPALASGTYTAQAAQSDAAGNTGTSTAHTFVVDTVAPVVTLVTPAASAQTNDTTPTYSGAAGNLTGDSASVTVNIYAGSSVGGAPAQTLVAARSGSTWTIDGSPALAAGTYTAQATQTDAAGTTGTSAAHTFVVDLTAPTITLTAPAAGSNSTSGTPAFAGVAGIATGDSASVTVNVFSGGTATGQPFQSLVTTRDGVTGAYTVNANPALPEGTYTAQAVQADGAGNSGTSTANTFTVNGPPIVTLTTPSAGAVLSDNTPTLGGGRGTAAGDLPTVTVYIYAGTTATGSPVQTLTDTGSGSTWQVTAATLADGTYTAQATQSDATLTGVSQAVTFRINTTPPVMCVVPRLVGKTLLAAKSLIRKAHCRLGAVTYARSRTVGKGHVISQSRRAGRRYPANTKISLVVSRGNRP